MPRARRTTALVCALAALPTLAAAQPADRLAQLEEWVEASRPLVEPDVTLADGSPAVRCATPQGDRRLRDAVEEELLTAELLRLPQVEERRRTVPVVFHVIRHPNGTGDVPEEWIDAQVALMNKKFKRRAKATFEIAEINRVKKKKWFLNCSPVKPNGSISKPWLKMTQRLAVDPATTLNIYTCQPKGGVLGVAIPAFFLEPDDPANSVIVRWDTLPGGDLFPYDLGYTAVHEVGHTFGLFHTFENGCDEPGDWVGDTAFEATPAFGCPIGRDTCPMSPGADPVTNPMDYSDDACFTKFTRKQGRRMRDTLDTYRPDLG